MFSLSEIHKDIFHLKFDDQLELNSHFLRFQEYYESPKFRDVPFELIDYIKWYAADNGGDFTYFTDWSGFNVPAYKIKECYDVIPDKNSQDEFMYLIAKKISKASKSGRAYLIGTTTDSKESTVRHEIAHGLFHVDKNYMNEMMSTLGCINHLKIFLDLRNWVISMGYAENVIEDEMQAYLATGLSDKGPEVHATIIKPFKDIFSKYYYKEQRMTEQKSTEEIIRESIEKVKAEGIAIVRGQVYVWEGDILVACDCFGAVMYAHGYRNGFEDIKNDNPPENATNPNLWIYKLLKILGKGSDWWTRYHFGFHHRKQLILETQGKDKNGKVTKVHTPCGTSKKSWKLSNDVGSVGLKEFLASRR